MRLALGDPAIEVVNLDKLTYGWKFGESGIGNTPDNAFVVH